jgi:diguanylate cyclase (GGDEF)-like protein/PAS domain S-box-containing protein
MTESLHARTRELREVIDGTADLIVAFDARGKITLVNKAFNEVIGYPDAIERGMSIIEIVHEASREDFGRAIAGLGEGARQRTLETTFVSREGAPIDVEGALTHEASVTRAIFRDVSARNHAQRALRAANVALERIASIDALTGIANRRTFDERLLEEVERARRYGTALSLVMIDIDFFKLYNDCYGHPQGDDCLRRVGGCMRTVARRAGELPARYGGEEFALLLPGADTATACEVAERLRAAIASMLLPHERHPLAIVTASLGVATFDAARMKEPFAIVVEADRALYEAKSGGRNRVVAASVTG